MTLRNSARLIPATYVGEAYAYITIALVLLGVTPAWSFIPRQLLTAVFVSLVCLALPIPILQFLTQQLDLSEGHIQYREGILRLAVTRAEVADISAIQVDKPWHLRIFRLSRVIISIKGTSKSLIMAGVESETAASLLMELDTPSIETQTPRLRLSTEQERDTGVGTVVLNLKELTATYMGNLVFVLFTIIASYELVVSTLDWTGVVDTSVVPSVATGVALFTIALLAALVMGYITIHNFGISKSQAGSWRIRYGLIDIRSRTITPGSVGGVRVSIGLVDALLRTMRIQVGTGDPITGSGGRLRFPSIEGQRSVAMLEDVTGLRNIHPQRLGIWPWIVHALVLTAGTIAMFGLFQALQMSEVSLLAPIIWILMLPQVLSIVTARAVAHPENDSVEVQRWRYGLIVEYLPLRSVALVNYREVPMLTWGLVELSAYTQKRVHILAFSTRRNLHKLTDFMIECEMDKP